MRHEVPPKVGYSVEEVKKRMEDYLDLSERRLRARLKETRKSKECSEETH